MAQQNSSTKQNKIPIVTSPIAILGKFDLLLRGLGGCVKKKLLAPYVAMKRPQRETNWSFGSGWQKKA